VSHYLKTHKVFSRPREPIKRKGAKMEAYKLYLVGSAKIKPGKFEEATKWWKEKGAPDTLSEPWTKSLRCYAGQFGLGGEYTIEIWQEIENYAALDQIDTWFIEDPEQAAEKRKIWQEADELFEWGPNRLMGDWPASSLLPD
jgi:hypothetical protein